MASLDLALSPDTWEGQLLPAAFAGREKQDKIARLWHYTNVENPSARQQNQMGCNPHASVNCRRWMRAALSFLSCGRSAVAPLIFSWKIDGSVPGGLELDHLVAEILGAGRDAGITVNQARIVHQIFVSERISNISGLGLIRIS